LNEYDLTCYEDNITNRLTETLDVFTDLISRFNTSIQIVFTKKDILIEKIKNEGDFSKLKNFGFKKEITFKNIVEFHIQLFVEIITKNSKNLENYHFYCSNLVDYNESVQLYKNVMDQILYQKSSSIDYPFISIFKFGFLTFHFYDLFIIYS
jgi:hypothetical protein